MAKKKASSHPRRSPRAGAELTPGTLRRLKLLFAPKDQAEAARLLVERCGNNLPFMETATPSELSRFRYAALRISGGDLTRLRWAVKLANEDWRDLLVEASFAENENAHRRWSPRPRSDRAGRGSTRRGDG
jgi:hypothetical protein